MTESFTLQSVWLYHLSVQASAIFCTSISSSGPCRMLRKVLYGKSFGDLLESMVVICVQSRPRAKESPSDLVWHAVFCHSERSRRISGFIFARQIIERCLDSARHDNRLFFAVE